MFNEQVMKILRQRNGLEKEDTSQDSDLQEMTPPHAFRECCGWRLGDPEWAREIVDLLHGCGYILQEQNNQQQRDGR